MYQPRVGDIGLSTIDGHLGAWINVGQSVIRDSSRFTHAFIYVGEGQIVEAMPKGAQLAPASTHPDAFYFTPKKMDQIQRDLVAAHALTMIGTPYSYLDYLSLALAHYKVRPGFVKNYVHSTKHMICSQLVDEAYLRANIHLFDDGRIPGDVTPGDLLYLALTDEAYACRGDAE